MIEITFFDLNWIQIMWDEVSTYYRDSPAGEIDAWPGIDLAKSRPNLGDEHSVNGNGVFSGDLSSWFRRDDTVLIPPFPLGRALAMHYDDRVGNRLGQSLSQ